MRQQYGADLAIYEEKNRECARRTGGSGEAVGNGRRRAGGTGTRHAAFDAGELTVQEAVDGVEGFLQGRDGLVVEGKDDFGEVGTDFEELDQAGQFEAAAHGAEEELVGSSQGLPGCP